MTAELQLTLDGGVYYNSTCKYCWSKFNKDHNRQEYCCEECSMKALKEQKAAYQRKRRKLIRDGEKVVRDSEKKKLGTGLLTSNRHKDFGREYRALEKEIKRLKLRRWEFYVLIFHLYNWGRKTIKLIYCMEKCFV